MFRHGIILLFSLLAGCTPAEMPVLNLPSYPRSDTGDPCALKDSCVVVFVTPWCPNCHEAIPFINDLSRHFAKSNVTGFRIVIGSDENERLEEMARQFEGAVFLDPEGTFKSAMRFNAVPSWWVTNKERKVLKSFSGGGMLSDGSDIGRSRAVQWFLKSKLELT